MRPLLPFFAERSPRNGTTVLRLRWGRIMASIVVCCVLSATLFAASAWIFLRHIRGVMGVNYVDLLLPPRWPEARRAIGDHYVAEGQSALRRGDYRGAFVQLRAGLARSPLHPRARLDLCALYLANRRPDLAQHLLVERPELFACDAEYLRATLQFLLDFHYDAELAKICDDLLPLETLDHVLPAYFAAQIAYLRGNYDRAESLLRQHKLTQHPEGLLLLARIESERGFPELALASLEALVNQGASSDECYPLLRDLRQKLGRTQEIERTAALRLAADPLSPLPRLDFLRLHHERGDQTALKKEINSYLTHFGENQTALLFLGDFAANAGLPDLARLIRDRFLRQNWPPEPAELMLAEAHLAAGEYQQGLTVLEALARQPGANSRSAAPVLDSLRAIALFGLGRADEAQLHLDHLLGQPNLRADNLQAVATRLIGLQKAPQARAILTHAVQIDPLNQAALTQLVELEAAQGHFDTLPAYVHRLLAMRKPSAHVLNQVAGRFGSDLNLLHPEQAPLLAAIRRASVAPRAAN